MIAATAASNTHVFWYLTRGSGVVALVLLTGGVLLGIGGTLRAGGRSLPRFGVASLHRSVTLLAIVFVGIHVITTVADSYTSIGLLDAFVPFASSYRPLWLGLGAVAFDLLVALVVTSLLRHVLSLRAWRGVHWLAYLCWPVALLHAFGTGSDARPGWFPVLGFASLLVVAAAAVRRALIAGIDPQLRSGAVAAAVLTPVLVGVWYVAGPAGSTWGHRPAVLAAAAPTSTSAPAVQVKQAVLPRRFSGPVAGNLVSTPTGDGRVLVSLRLRLRGHLGGVARVDLQGFPLDGGGVSLTASGVSFVPATTGRVYTGDVTSLAGGTIGTVVRDSSGHVVDLSFDLRIDAGRNRVLGTVAGREAT